MSYRTLLVAGLRATLEPALLGWGFAKGEPLRWRQDDLEIRTVGDSKAVDPFQGGALTLEFERSNDGQFEVKLAGRVRVDQLLDAGQREQFLTVRNAVACRLPLPDDRHVALIPASLLQRYLRASEPAGELEPHFWMCYRTAEDVLDWAEVLTRTLPDLVDRTKTLDPHALLLGQRLNW